MVHLDQGSRVALLLLDMSAAFDTPDHTTLLNRFNKEFGIRGKPLKWFESYFSERTQSVVIRGVKSEPVPLSQGVPQGSVISPKAYTMYTKSLGDIIEHHGLQYHIYADDIQIYMPLSHPRNIERLELCLRDLYTWLTANKLKLNSSKTELLQITPLNKPPVDLSLTVNGNIIKCSDKVNDLGVLFCRALTKRSISQNFQYEIFCIIHVSLSFSILCQKILAKNHWQSSFLGSIKTLYLIFRVGFDNQNTLSNARVYNTYNLAANLYF